MKRTPLLGIGVGLGLGPCVGLVLALAATIARAEPGQVTQSRQVPAFHGIDLGGVLTVEATIAPGQPASVQIVGDADLVDKVTATVKDGILVLDTRDLHINRRNAHLRAIVTAPGLDALAISGTGGMKVTGISGERLAVALSGTGSLTMQGTIGELRATVSGTGDIAGKRLDARDVVVQITGAGSARLNATRSVDARVGGVGSVSVHGHPAQVKKSVSGVGSIHIE